MKIKINGILGIFDECRIYCITIQLNETKTIIMNDKEFCEIINKN